MRPTTEVAVRAVVSGDSTIHNREARTETALSVLRGDTEGATPTDAPLLLKQSQVAKLLNISRQTVRALTKAGKLCPVLIKAGREFMSKDRNGAEFVRRSDVLRYPYTQVAGLALARS